MSAGEKYIDEYWLALSKKVVLQYLVAYKQVPRN